MKVAKAVVKAGLGPEGQLITCRVGHLRKAGGFLTEPANAGLFLLYDELNLALLYGYLFTGSLIHMLFSVFIK
jgi:hypothetical protein